MDLNQFLSLLRETKRDWYLEPDWRSSQKGLIRCRFMECPISTMRDAVGSEFMFVARDLGLDAELAKHIADAADELEGYDVELRAKLLEACGLSDIGRS